MEKQKNKQTKSITDCLGAPEAQLDKNLIIDLNKVEADLKQEYPDANLPNCYQEIYAWYNGAETREPSEQRYHTYRENVLYDFYKNYNLIEVALTDDGRLFLVPEEVIDKVQQYILDNPLNDNTYMDAIFSHDGQYYNINIT